MGTSFRLTNSYVFCIQRYWLKQFDLTTNAEAGVKRPSLRASRLCRAVIKTVYGYPDNRRYLHANRHLTVWATRILSGSAAVDAIPPELDDAGWVKIYPSV